MTSTSLRVLATATILALLAGANPAARADYVVDATASDGNSSGSILGQLDLTTGRFTTIATLSINVISLTSGAGGNLYAGGNDGNLYTLGSGDTTTRFGSVSDPYVLSGLAYAGPIGFVGVQADINPYGADSVTIAPDGNGISAPSFLGAKFFGFGSSGGALAYGPDGSLYFDALPLAGTLPGPAQLFRLDPTTGTATAIGTKLGVGYDPLALVTAGGTLYGIDSVTASGSGTIGIYTINTSTGKATSTGVDVTGLPDGYTLDAVAMPSAVPEPSSLALALVGGALAGLARAMTRRPKPRRASHA
jgi:hypothetical protein